MARYFVFSLASLFVALNVFALAPPQEEGQSPYSIFLLMGALFMIMYFFVIRPQQKKVKQHKELVTSLKKDDEVILNSGIYGKIVRVSNDTEKSHIQVEIADKVVVKVVKDSIADVLNKKGKQEAPKKEKTDKSSNGKQTKSEEKKPSASKRGGSQRKTAKNSAKSESAKSEAEQNSEKDESPAAKSVNAEDKSSQSNVSKTPAAKRRKKSENKDDKASPAKGDGETKSAKS